MSLARSSFKKITLEEEKVKSLPSFLLGEKKIIFFEPHQTIQEIQDTILSSKIQS